MFTLLHVALLTCGLGASLLNQSLPYEKNNDSEYQLKYDNHKNVVYNDNDYSITFTANEFNYYVYEHLYVCFAEDVASHDFGDSTMVYNNETYTFDDFDLGSAIDYLYDENTSTQMLEFDFIEKKFYYGVYDETLEDYEFNIVNSNVVWNIASNTAYVTIKAAIEQDIIANQPYIFDDDNYQITISADYLNNVEYRHLFELFYRHIEYYYQNLANTTMVYDTQTYTYDELLRDGDTYELFYVLIEDHYIYLNGYHFSLYEGESYENLDDSVVWHLNQYVYNDIKNALQQDFYYYSLPVYNPFMEIVDIMTSGITTFSTGLGSGVSDLVEDVFLTEDNHLSVFASITMVFAGIALAIGFSRFVMNYLTSLGAKK